MAVISTTYSGKQFSVYLGSEDTVRTFDATSNWSANYSVYMFVCTTIKSWVVRKWS